MPAHVHLINSDGEARERLADDTASGGEPTSAMQQTIRELAERLPVTSTLHVARDGEGCHFAWIDYVQDMYPFGEVIRLAASGALGAGGVNQPRYFDTVAEFVASLPLTPDRVRACAELALEAFWASAVWQLPSVQSGDMAPGECDPLESIARQTIALWVSNNDPAFANDPDRLRTNALIRDVR
jgi:hypothetical protein